MGYCCSDRCFNTPHAWQVGARQGRAGRLLLACVGWCRKGSMGVVNRGRACRSIAQSHCPSGVFPSPLQLGWISVRQFNGSNLRPGQTVSTWITSQAAAPASGVRIVPTWAPAADPVFVGFRTAAGGDARLGEEFVKKLNVYTGVGGARGVHRCAALGRGFPSRGRLPPQASCGGSAQPADCPPALIPPPRFAANITGSNDAKMTTFQAAMGGEYRCWRWGGGALEMGGHSAGWRARRELAGR